MSDEFKQMRIVRDPDGIEADRIMSEEQYQQEFGKELELQRWYAEVEAQRRWDIRKQIEAEAWPEWVKALFGLSFFVAFMWLIWYFFTCGFC